MFRNLEAGLVKDRRKRHLKNFFVVFVESDDTDDAKKYIYTGTYRYSVLLKMITGLVCTRLH